MQSMSTGAIVDGRYLAERKIGAGAMGEVWIGEHIGVGYPVAIKTMLSDAVNKPEVVERFKREALLLGRIRSDYVARILDFVKDPKYGHVLVLDFIEGEVFSQTIKRTKITVEEAVEIGTDIVSGLVDLHQTNIVHRDLKPSNIILEQRRDGKKRAVIVDFGVSRLMKSETPTDFEEMSNLTSAGMALGTLEYMAPEQMLDSRGVTGAADLYAVGAMLFRAVAGQHVFGNVNEIELTRAKLLKDSPPLNTARSDPLAKGLESIVAKALQKKPANRYQKASDMLADLLALRDQMRSTANASENTGRDTPTHRINPPPLPQRPQAVMPAQPSPPPSSPVGVIMPAPISVRGGGPSSGPMSFDSLMPPPPGMPKAKVIVIAVMTLLAGLVLGAVLFGGAPPPAP